MEYPDLAGVATADLVDTIGTGKFSATYINWARTMQLLRQHAKGWLPDLVPAPDGEVLHRAPVGGFLLIRFRNGQDTTPAVPQAVMNNRNQAIRLEQITARDITDTHRRGVCMAAAFTFGLAYELWAKLPLESGYAEPEPKEEPAAEPAAEQELDPRVQDAAMHILGLHKGGETDALQLYLEQISCDKPFKNKVWRTLPPETKDFISSLKGKK